jgi:hypothetical protein
MQRVEFGVLLCYSEKEEQLRMTLNSLTKMPRYREGAHRNRQDVFLAQASTSACAPPEL